MNKLHIKISPEGTLPLSPPQQQFLMKHAGKDALVEVIKPKRTSAQNNALHLWFMHVATELNLAGYTVQLILKEKVDIDWTPELVKELLWRTAQRAILKKRSTTELKKTEDIDKVWEHLNRHLGEKFGIHIPFPDVHQIGGMCGRKGCPQCPQLSPP